MDGTCKTCGCTRASKRQFAKHDECNPCYRRRRRAEDGRYSKGERRIGKRAEQKRRWDRENRPRKAARGR